MTVCFCRLSTFWSFVPISILIVSMYYVSVTSYKSILFKNFYALSLVKKNVRTIFKITTSCTAAYYEIFMNKSCYKSTNIDKNKSRENAGLRKWQIFFRNTFTPFVGLLDRIYNKEHKVEAFKHFVLFFFSTHSLGGFKSMIACSRAASVLWIWCVNWPIILLEQVGTSNLKTEAALEKAGIQYRWFDRLGHFYRHT